MTVKTVLNERDKKDLKALWAADEALYQLWKRSEIGSNQMAAINRLQEQFIHPAIKKLTR